jgi:hypothetical protein
MNYKVLVIAIIIAVISSIVYAEDRYETGIDPNQVLVADLDKDGYKDMLVANYWGDTISVFMNKRNGTFTSQIAYQVLPKYPFLSIGDVDNDGWLDMIVSYGWDKVWVFINNKNGTFRDKAEYDFYPSTLPVKVIDIDNDGWKDIVGLTWGEQVSVILNKRDGTFATPNQFPFDGANGIDFVAFDIENDGLIDIVLTTNPDSLLPDSKNYLNIMKNNGDYTFIKNQSFVLGSKDTFLSHADVDNDGYIDIICTNPYLNAISVYKNNKDGSFADPVDYDVNGEYPNRVCLVDIDKDGFVDMLVSNLKSKNIRIFSNNGDGTFTSGTEYPTGSEPLMVFADDVNKDGWIDMITSCRANGNTWVYLNDRNGHFNSGKNYGRGSYFYYSTHAVTEDIDNDGLKDMIISCASKKDYISVFRNIGNGEFDNSHLEIENKADSPIKTGTEFDIALYLRSYPKEVTVDVYFIMIDPIGVIYSGMEWNKGIKPVFKGLTLPPNIFIDGVSLQHLIIPNLKPPITPATGSYTFAMAFFKTDTANLISNIATTSFDVAQ